MLAALVALATTAGFTAIVPEAAHATGPLATVRQLAGTIPVPYDEPRDVVRSVT